VVGTGLTTRSLYLEGRSPAILDTSRELTGFVAALLAEETPGGLRIVGL
jgi:hypothetical protein